MESSKFPIEYAVDPYKAEWKSAKTLLRTKPLQGFREMKSLAEAGSTMSMLELGRAYALGIGTEKNPGEAEAWFERVAATGSARANFYLGRFYLRLERYNEAKKAYEFSAARRFAPAQLDLGKIYFLGLGVPKDIDRARRYFAQPSEAGNVFAKRLLARLLIENGEKLTGNRMLLSSFWDLATVLVTEGFDSTRLVR